jgi:hypothetical protein
MLSQAVIELENKLLKLSNISYNSIDSLMRKIIKSYNITAKELHNAFKQKNKKTPDDWIKGKMKKLQEDHKEIASGEKKDDEGYMARNELDSIERAIKNLRKSIKSGNQQLPAWVQSKITKAADYIDTASEYLESDEKVDEETRRLPGTRGTILHGSETKVAPSTGAKALTPSGAAQLGPKAQELQKKEAQKVNLPPFVKTQKEEISLVEKILGEEKCGKGMYWCNTDKVCKPLQGMKVPGQKIKPTEVGIGKPVSEGSCNHTKKGKSCPVHGMDQCPMSEERDPKGPVKSYKSPEEIAKKHGVSVEQIKKQLEIGTKVEFEHTTSKSSARITALQHLDEKPDYYTKLKKMETQKESNIVRDMNGNVYAEFIDIIKSGSIEEENPCWKGYTQVGMKSKNGKEVPNCVPSKGVPKAKGYKKKDVNEAVRLQAQTGNNIFVTLSWRGKYYTIQLFFPQAKIPSRIEISDEIQKIYPSSRVMTYRVADFKTGEPIVYAYKGGDAGKLGPNKNYVKPMGEQREMEPPRERVGPLTNIDIPQSEREAAKKRILAKVAAKRKEREMKEEVEISEAKKSEMPCNKPKAQAVGDSQTGKSHVVKACSDGQEKLIRFGQRGVKGSPKKEGESKAYASRRNRFQTRHAKNIAKGKMSAAYWANKVKW